MKIIVCMYNNLRTGYLGMVLVKINNENGLKNENKKEYLLNNGQS
jgi:hypothetical protein